MRQRTTEYWAPRLLAAGLTAGCFVSGIAGTPPRQAGPTLDGFVENRGQLDPSVLFYADGGRTAIYFTASGPVLEIRDPASPIVDAARPPLDRPTRLRERRRSGPPRRFAVGVRPLTPTGAVDVEGLGERKGRYNFVLGDDPQAWRPGVRVFDRVVYHDVWPGIDLEYRLDGRRLVYEIVAGPAADVSHVRFEYDGASAHEARERTLRVETPLGTIEDRPRPGDERTREILIAERPDVDSQAGVFAGEEALAVSWSSFLGGERDDSIFGVALAGGEFPVVTGVTRSMSFPTTLGVLETNYGGSFDAFVTKFEADGSTLIWSTFLGDVGDDRGWAVRVDGSGNPIVAGVTGSASFPTTPGAFDTTPNGSYDAFVTKLSADGTALVWSTLFGGADKEWDVSGLELDAADRPTFIGTTDSGDMPTSAGAYDSVLGGGQDAFVARLESDGSALVFSTYLGGGASDSGEDVALDSAGRPVVAGRTTSADYPTTPGAFQVGSSAMRDGFVTKLAADAGSLVFSTYLGGNGNDECFAVALDGSDRVLVTGGTESTDFPTTAGSFQQTSQGARDIFVSKLESDGSALAWGTYYGGGGFEDGFDIVVDSAGRPVVVGETCSLDFPVAGPAWDASYNFACDAFVARLEPDGSSPVFSTFVGGDRRDLAHAVALGPMRLLVGGETLSGNFPSAPWSYDATHNSPGVWTDGFLLEMLSPLYCTHLTGQSVPELTFSKAAGGACPELAPEGNLIDLIEGDLSQVGPTDIGVVEIVACGSPLVTFPTDTVPASGDLLFQLARYSPGGAYTDGGGPGLVGSRVVLAGDCP